MEIFTAASHHEVLVLVIQIAVLLLVARLLGELAQRLGQPSVVGEILAGIVLGPSLLSGLVPALGEWLVPHTPVQGYLLEVVSLIGAMFLLLITGLETDLTLIRRHARAAMGISWGGIVFTFFTGFLLGQFLPDFLLGNPEERLVFSLFIATAMSITAIPVLAKVLMDLNLMRRDIGQIILAAGMNDDTTGWILLSVVAGLASGQQVSAGSFIQIVGSVLAFLGLSFTLGRWFIRKLLDYVQDEMISRDRILTLVVSMTFIWGAITQALNLEAVLGAFVMGILFAQMPRLPEEVHKKLESVALGIFAPIFFATAGLKVNARNLFEPQLFLIAGLVILVASLGKIIGAYVGARMIGKKDHWTALGFGVGLNARGAMEIIIATIGLNLGILSQDMFSVVVVMAVATSLMAPPALRWVMQYVKPDEQEIKRLRQEELAAGSRIASLRRILLPVRQRESSQAPIQTIEATILEKLSGKRRLSVTLLNVPTNGESSAAKTYLSQLSRLFNHEEVLTKVVPGADPSEVILDEMEKNYDLLVLGASAKNRGGNVLFTPIVDYLVRMSPALTMVVKGERIQPDWIPRRILVPTNGSRAAKNAAELGFLLAAPDGGVCLLNVVEHKPDTYHLDVLSEDLNRQLEVGQKLVNDLAVLGEGGPARIEKMVKAGREPETVILQTAQENVVDLIILGTDVRMGSERLFLGPRVEYILANSTCPVVVINS